MSISPQSAVSKNCHPSSNPPVAMQSIANRAANQAVRTTNTMAFIEKEIFSTCANLFLCVSSFNEHSQRFYLKLGYEKIGILKDYLVEGHDEILMRKTTSPILKRSRLGV